MKITGPRALDFNQYGFFNVEDKPTGTTFVHWETRWDTSWVNSHSGEELTVYMDFPWGAYIRATAIDKDNKPLEVVDLDLKVGTPEGGTHSILISGIPEPEAGREWSMTVQGIHPNAHSICIEMFGANGGIDRAFPRGRKEMDFKCNFACEGETFISITVRDEFMFQIGKTIGKVKVAPKGSFREGQASELVGVPGRKVVPGFGPDMPPSALTPRASSGLVRAGMQPSGSPAAHMKAAPGARAPAGSDLSDPPNDHLNMFADRRRR